MMKINGITDIFFDLDHTLWDFDRNSALTFDRIFKINKISANLDEFLSQYEPINLNYWKLYREEKIDKESLRYKRLYDSFEALNLKIPDEIINKLSYDYIAHLSSFNHLFDDAIQTLEYLFEHYKLHIITNGFSEVQQGKLDNSKITHFFKTITNSEMTGAKKPNPIIFEHALNLARTEPSRSIMIGDNYEADILGAKNYGMEVIHFNIHNEENINGVLQVRSLSELKNYL